MCSGIALWSHRSGQNDFYGTKTSEKRTEMSHRSALWDKLIRNWSQNVPLEWPNRFLWDNNVGKASRNVS